MSKSARLALLVLLTLGFARLFAAEPEEIAALRLKAEKGNALAQYNLGLAYSQGHLVPADLAEAFAWLSLASESGATGKALDSLLGSITDQQLTEGRTRLGTYRAALAAKNATATPSRSGTAKLPSRGFSFEPPPTTVPPTSETSTPVTKAPEAPATPATSPGDGSDRTELAQSRKDLEKARADLVAAGNELTALRASVTRLTGELQAARQELDALKAAPPLTPTETPKAEPVAPKKP